jgi:hypothetical protein
MSSGFVKPTTETPMPSDVIGKSTGNHASITGSAQEQYYRFMLMKEKHEVRKESSDAPAYLKAVSEIETIEEDILKKLVKITESSPEFAQVVSITGTQDRFEQARVLAKHVYDRVQAEQILSFYTPDAATLKKNFYEKTLASSQDRFQKVAKGATENGGTVGRAVVDFLAGLAGLRVA